MIEEELWNMFYRGLDSREFEGRRILSPSNPIININHTPNKIHSYSSVFMTL